jgi:hypothetical protein
LLDYSGIVDMGNSRKGEIGVVRKKSWLHFQNAVVEDMDSEEI